MCLFCSTKCCFIFFNLLLLASGVALIALGVLQYSTYSQMGVFAGSSLSKIAIVLISAGVIIALVSLLGLCGAFTNNSSMVACFICILIMIIILEIATGAVFYVFRSRVRHFNPTQREKFQTAILQANSAISNKARGAIYEYKEKKRHAINRIQEKFRCCGADSYTDWFKSVGWEKHDAVPDSCCTEKTEGCGQNKDKVHKQGCISAIKFFLVKNFLWVGGVCITLGVTEVFGVLVGVCLCLDIKRKNYENIR